MPTESLANAYDHLQQGLADVIIAGGSESCIHPITLASFSSMQALSKLQPEIKKLQAKYKDDKQRLNQEMMRFYQENKVNPFSSCLPLVAQLPVFISLFYMLRHDLRFDICPGVQKAAAAKGLHTPIACGPVPDAHFLGIPDITAPAHGSTLIILLILYVGSQLLSSLLMPATVDPTQRRIFLALFVVQLGWIIAVIANVAMDRYVFSLKIDVADNLQARRAMTQMRIVRQAINVMIGNPNLSAMRIKRRALR